MANKSFSELLSGFPCAEGLRGVNTCARTIVAAAGIETTQYTYRSGNALYAAEKIAGKWALREERGLHDNVRELSVLLGDSPLSVTQFTLELPHDEAACLLAVMDCYAQAALQQAVGNDANSVNEQTVSQVFLQPRENSALAFLLSVCHGIHPDTSRSLNELVSRGLCGQRGGTFLLNDELAALATALALPQGAVSLCVWNSSDGFAACLPSFAIQGTLHDILLVTVGLDCITICSLCADALLDVIENILSCPRLSDDEIQSDTVSWKCGCGSINTGKFCAGCGKPKPIAAPVPAFVDGSWKCACGSVNKGAFCPKCGSRKQNTAPTSDGTWHCSCGRVNTGVFCPNCGAKRPS